MTLNSINDCVKLNNGVEMPSLGLGVFKVDDGQTVIDTTTYAVNVGYRLIDTASIYNNEKGVGTAIKQCGIPREKLFITSKLWNDSQGYDLTLKAFEKTMSDLQLTYLDLYLIHWPLPKNNTYIATWKALEALYQEGRIRAIGVSNFEPEWIQNIINECDIVPMVNQVEFHPYFQQKELREFCEANGVQIQAWAPLARGRIFEDETLIKLADKYGKSVAQFVIRWELQCKVATIPKSATRERMVSNADVFDFEIDEQDMKAMEGLNRNMRIGPNPHDFYKVRL